MPWHRAASGVELEQLLGHVAHGLLDLLLRLVPGGPTQAIERRAAGAGVLLDEVETLDRDEQLVIAVISKLEKLLHDVAVPNRKLLEPDELSDAIVDMNDVVADLQVAEIGEKRCGEGSLSTRARPSAIFLEDIGFGIDLERRRGNPKPTRQQALGNEHRPLDAFVGLPRRQGAHVIVAKQFDGSFRSPVCARHKQHGLATLTRLPNIGHPIADPAPKLLRRLRGDVSGRRLMRRRLPVIADGQLFEGDRVSEKRLDLLRRCEELVRWTTFAG